MLLGAIVAVFIVEGSVTPGPAVEVIVSGLLGLTLLLALSTANARPTAVFWGRVVTLVVIGLSIAEAASGNGEGRAMHIALGLLVGLVPPLIIVGVVRTLRARRAVTVEAVLGVLSVYILLGLFFAYVYATMNRVGGAFFANGQAATIAHCVYFSFTTLTTVGFGDLTARSNLGHTLSASEALLGQIYLVTVVSLIVANLGRGRPVARAAGG